MKSLATVTLFLRIPPELKARIEDAAKNPEQHGRSYWDRKSMQDLAIEALQTAFPSPEQKAHAAAKESESKKPNLATLYSMFDDDGTEQRPPRARRARKLASTARSPSSPIARSTKRSKLASSAIAPAASSRRRRARPRRSR